MSEINTKDEYIALLLQHLHEARAKYEELTKELQTLKEEEYTPKEKAISLSQIQLSNTIDELDITNNYENKPSIQSKIQKAVDYAIKLAQEEQRFQ